MPRTIKKTVYKFDELDERAKDKARESFRTKDYWIDQGDINMISDDLKEYLEEQGFPNADVSWSVGYCQGDYAAFKSEINLDKVAVRILDPFDLEVLKNCTDAENGFGLREFNVSVDYGGRRESSRLSFEYDDYELWVVVERDGVTYNVAEKLEAALESEIERLTSELYDRARSEIDYKYSDEYVDECLIANDYEFEEDGTPC